MGGGGQTPKERQCFRLNHAPFRDSTEAEHDKG